MLNSQAKVKLAVDKESATLNVGFKPRSSRTLYDICDLNGRILKTGGIDSSNTDVDLDGLSNKVYILLVLDGDRVFTEKFDLRS
ncbi:MAG TPA: T9SS type A sorting domain-containing protein [Cryomorphaceae bacterium]|nr:T9SS type A sorting domain-containing protein [Cryomorphaceae bacterium]